MGTSTNDQLEKPMGDPTDPNWFRQVLGQYPTGVCVVTAAEPDGRRAGFVVGSFTSVSLDPPLVAFLPDKRSTSWPRIRSVGRFCVNILSAEQEDVCRKFAGRDEDKFAGIACREAESGSPIIEGAVAWIECDLDTVHEAGDHYIALGRVRRMEVQSSSLPLLFFRGGYGRFAPLSLAATGSGLIEQLRDVDLLRPEMERIVSDVPGAWCNASALVEDEIVVLASARGSDSVSPATFVGERMPFAPPLGRVFAAWMDEASVERWLDDVPSEAERAREREELTTVRQQGYSAIPRVAAWRWLEATRARIAAAPDAVDREELLSQMRALSHEFSASEEQVESDIGVIRVPVFGPDGEVALQLSVYAPVRPTGEVARSYVERARGAGRRATEHLAGRPRVSTER